MFKYIKHNRGSILIWSVMIGFIMLSGFFFFSMRQISKINASSEAIEYQNQKAYFDSYIEYLKNNPAESDHSDFNGITVEYLTHNTDEITGFLDTYEEDTYNFGGDITIYWNECSDNNKADFLLTNGVVEDLKQHITVPSCPPESIGYDDDIDETVTNPFSIGAINAPLYYRITPNGMATQLVDEKWHLKAYMDLDYGQTFETELTF